MKKLKPAVQEGRRKPLKIRKGDTVVIIAGTDRGKKGRVLRVDTVRQRVLVENRNLMKKHTRPNPPQQPGGVVEREAPMHVSNVMLWSDKKNRGSRVAIERDDEGHPVRVLKRERA